jgi:hypothetical protein
MLVAVFYVLIAVVTPFLVPTAYGAPVVEVDPIQSKGKPVKDDGVPTYEQYIELSKKKKWFPVDPIEKLKNTCRKYSQVRKFWKLHSDS